MITGIIKCMPSKFVFHEYGARRFVRDFVQRPNDNENSCFLFTLSAIPKVNVLHFYLLIAGRIRYRANISSIEGRASRDFHDGRGPIHGNAWAILTAPVVRAPFRIEMKGFRGFRYTEELW